MNEEFFERLRERVLPYFDDVGSHEFSHTKRVHDMAIKISEGEKVDIDVVRVAALLHDIARGKQDRGEVDCHADAGAKIARNILKEMDFPEDKINSVTYSIEVHRHSKGITPNTKEALIIQDADRLDALGAITIGRMFASGEKKGKQLHNPDINSEIWKGKDYSGVSSKTTIDAFYNKILKIRPENFNTQKAREIAKSRYDYVYDFVERFKKEWVGKL